MSIEMNTDEMGRADLCVVKTLLRWVVLNPPCHCNVLVRSQDTTASFITLVTCTLVSRGCLCNNIGYYKHNTQNRAIKLGA